MSTTGNSQLFRAAKGLPAPDDVTSDTPDPVTPLPVAALLASSLMAAKIECDSGEDVDRLVAEMWTRGLRIVAARQSDGAEAGPDIDRRLLEDEDGAPYPDAVQEVVHEWQREAFAAGYMKAAALQAAPVSIDRERLAKALHADAESIESDATDWTDCDDKDGHREFAAFLIAEYDRLSHAE